MNFYVIFFVFLCVCVFLEDFSCVGVINILSWFGNIMVIIFFKLVKMFCLIFFLNSYNAWTELEFVHYLIVRMIQRSPKINK